MSKSAKGFSLLELLIVVTIILIIAMIAIPNILTSMKATKETAAVASLKTLTAAQVLYSATGGNFGTIPQLIGAATLDSRFGETMNGYNFTVTTGGGEYTAEASPSSPTSGRYAYYTN